MNLDEKLKRIKELKEKEERLRYEVSGISGSAYAGASYREMEYLDNIQEFYNEKIKECRDEIEMIKETI